MAWDPIRKDGRKDGHNLADYDAAVREFSWQRARFRLDGLPGGRGLNIAYEAVDRHAAGPRGDAVALRCVAKDGSVSELTYADLRGRPAGSPTCCGTWGWARATGSSPCLAGCRSCTSRPWAR